MNEQMHGQIDACMDKRMDRGPGIQARNEPTDRTCNSLRVWQLAVPLALHEPDSGKVHKQQWVANDWYRLLACMGPVQYSAWQIGSKTTAIDPLSGALRLARSSSLYEQAQNLVEVKTAASC